MVDFLKDKRRELTAIAKNIGLLSGCSEDFINRYCPSGYSSENVIMEAFTRIAMEFAMLDIAPKIKIHQRPQDAEFDVDFISGGTEQVMEGKTRYISSTTYPTLDISFRKNDALMERGGLLFVLCLNDLEYFIWDLSEYEPTTGTWTKNHYTAYNANNYRETETKRCFDIKRAKYKGNLGHWLYG